jgi:hypothetical protein
LHAVKDDHIRPGLDRERGVEIGPCAADLDVDRDFPACDFAQFEDLDLKIVRPCPIRVTTGGALVDAFG